MRSALKNPLEEKNYIECEEYIALYYLGINIIYLIESTPKSFFSERTNKIIEKVKKKSVEIQELRNQLDRRYNEKVH